MHLSGQTPLFRAKQLERVTGVESIYLKLEGANPTGHKNDRIAEVLVKYAIQQGYSALFVHSSERYLQSILYFSKSYGLEIHAPLGTMEDLKPKKHSEIHWHAIKVPNKEIMVETYESYAAENGFFFLSEWERRPFIRGLAIQKMMEEAIDKISTPTTLWTQAKGGYTLSSLYQELMRAWANDRLNALPVLNCGMDSLLLEAIRTDVSTKYFSKAKLSQVRQSIETTKTTLHGVSLDEAKEAAKMIKQLENITISPKEAYALAAFVKNPPVDTGHHIIFLNDGRSDIKITEISKEPTLDLNWVVEHTRKLLEPYHDSIEETQDAVKKAIDLGFIFTAMRRDELHGICIVVHMGFKDFIPTYHLAYIGVKKGNSGRGVATELMNSAIEKTKGNLSLHVDIPNKRAKKLYEKMGFVHTYDRMLYKG